MGAKNLTDKVKLRIEKFKRDCTLKHKGKYDYSMVVLYHSKDKVGIICPSHGLFYQSASNHKHGNGCRECSGEENAKVKSSSKEAFVDKARVVWGEKYDYSEVEYKHCETKVKIICPDHGGFLKSPNQHLVKFGGCSLCHKNNKSKEYLSKFITRAREVHGDEYCYESTEHMGSRFNVTIKCPKHGQFKMRMSSHLKGQKCQKCSKENPNQGIFMFAEWGDEHIEKHMEEYGHLPSTCYLLSFTLDGKHCYKVGITTRSTDERIVDLKNKSRREGFPLTGLELIEEVNLTHKESYEMEQKVLTELRKMGEQVKIKIRGHTETFYIPPSDVISQLFLSHLPTDYTPPDSPTKAS